MAFLVNKVDMEKVCLDCAGVYGLHVRLPRKLHFLVTSPLSFLGFPHETFFLLFFDTAAAQSIKNDQ